MPWIKQIDNDKAEGELKNIYESIKSSRGKLSNIMKIHSLLPTTMEKHIEFYTSIMFNKSTINREEKELLAVVVSVANNCDYCILHHSEALNYYWKDNSKIENLIKDYKSLELPVKTLAILKYAEKLTLTPNLVNEDDIQNLRIHDISDKDILNLNLIVSYFNFVNRIALGLGVEFSKEEIKGYKY